ncbi:MAG: hypothetical protein U0163_19210 [Gemmatimonadaceae bacterium]
MCAAQPDGSNSVDLTNDPAFDGNPTVSDGSKIAFETSSGQPGDSDECRRFKPSNLTQSAAVEQEPAGHPLDTRSSSPRIDGNFEIYVQNEDGSGLRQITNDPGTDNFPAWSPDGKYIVFASNRTGTFQPYGTRANGTGLRA